MKGRAAVFEKAGKSFENAVSEGLEMLRSRGTYVELGHITPNSMLSLDVSRLVAKQIRLLGVGHYDPGIIPMGLDFLVRTRDKYALTSIVSHQFPLEQINEAFEASEWFNRQSGSQVTRAIGTP